MKKEQTFSREGYLEENYHYFHLRDTAGQERDYHYHEFDKIVLLLSGRVDYAVESVSYALRPWDILLVKHHVIHKALIDKSVPYERIILYLDGGYFERLQPEAGLMNCFEQADRSAPRWSGPCRPMSGRRETRSSARRPSATATSSSCWC